MGICPRFRVSVYWGNVRVYSKLDWLLGLFMVMFELCDCTWLPPNTYLEWNKLRADQGGQVMSQHGTLKRSWLVRCWEASLFGLVNVPEGLLNKRDLVPKSKSASSHHPVCWSWVELMDLGPLEWLCSQLPQVNGWKVNMLKALYSPFLSTVVRYQRNRRHILGFRVPYNLMELKM